MIVHSFILKLFSFFFLTMLVTVQLSAQKNTTHLSSISFQHLNTSNGLSYSGVNDMCTDQKGNLWLATGNGLNMFNGRSVEKYYASDHPLLKSSNIIHVTCDSSNRIWILTAGGNVAMLDERRKMHRLSLYVKDTLLRTAWILNSQHGNIVLFNRKGHYIFSPDKKAFTDTLDISFFSRLPITGFDTIERKGFRQVFHYDDDNYLYVKEHVVFKVNFKTAQVKKYPLHGCNALFRWGNESLFSFNRISNKAQIINLVTGDTSYPFENITDQAGNKVTAYLFYGEQIGPSRFLFTTFSNGIYIYDSSANKIFNYRHNVADPASVADNATSTIAVGKKGWIFFTCNPIGVSYFNSNDFISNQVAFLDKKGNGYDSYIAGIATKDNNTYYIGTAEGLLEWKHNSNTTTFLSYKDDKGNLLPDNSEVSSIVMDAYGRIWCTTLTQGVFVIDKDHRLLKHFKNTGDSKNTLKIKRVTFLVAGPDGYMWVGGGNGLSRINPENFEVDNFKTDPILSKFDSTFCAPIMFSDKNNMWIATDFSGVFHYNFLTKKIDTFNVSKGLIDNGIFDVEVDRNKNIYVGTRLGMSIIFPNGRIKNISQKDGLLIDRAEGFLLDKHNRLWIGNDIGLACYNPADSSLRTFDVRHGLSIYGFRVNSYFQMPGGEFAFGTPRGMQYFDPDDLFNKNITINATISKIETGDIVSGITVNAVFDLAAGDNQVTFHFGSVDFSPPFRTYYEYMLEGVDKSWIRVADQYSVRYNSLPPGKLVFKLRVSNDGKTWQDADNTVTVIVATPFWKTWWFRVAGILVGLSLIWYVINFYRQKQKKKQQELETELVITYFASQINKHYNTEELLWDVAKNCISQLYFEDCVIYQLDAQRNVLVQKAAYGPKNPVDFTIVAPIEIKVGQGIVGAVAKTGKAEIISNTSLDNRYIVDDQRRYSEITVPVIIDGKVVGVIDSEHQRKNFFNNQHLKILNTIATLCASQIQLVRMEEEKEKAKIELLHNKQKALESRLQSLRLQMNPHFLFNALNSVQQMILANEEMIATRYLSRFSKLLRAILVHSDKETITLKEELEILHLYVELESIRFKEAFKYTIICDESIDVDEVKIPTLLIQPFVENAIWHGLMHKENDRQLKVTFVEKGEWLQCIVEDNGVGRKKAQEIKGISMNGAKHQSKGIAVSTERLNSMKSREGVSGNIEFTDMYKEDGTAAGTRIAINFPILN